MLLLAASSDVVVNGYFRVCMSSRHTDTDSSNFESFQPVHDQPFRGFVTIYNALGEILSCQLN